jgi:hypothetical protein
MSAKHKIDRCAVSPRKLNAVVADACLNASIAIIDDALWASPSIKQRSAIRFSHPSVQGTAKSGCTSRPPAAIKSP